MNNPLTDFCKSIEPLAFEVVPEMFPSRQFDRKGNKWTSPYKLNGELSREKATSKPRPDKVVISYPCQQTNYRLKALEQGGDSTNVIDLYMADTGKDFYEALKDIASMVGKELPKSTDFDKEKYAKEKKTQDRLSAIFQQMKEALYTPEASSTLQYLKQHRGYTDEYIKWANFGYVSDKAPYFKELLQLLTYTTPDKEHRPFYVPSKGIGIGITHPFAIAYASEGDTKGFNFRAIHESDQYRKYYSAYTSAEDTQRYALFNMTPAKAQYKRIVLVEGELDTLRGTYAGIPNLVGLSQGVLTEYQLDQIKRKGFTEVTLLVDTEELVNEEGKDPEEKRNKSKQSCASMIERIEKAGLSAYVAYLPSEHGEKVDLDSYLFGLEGDALKAKAEEVKALLNNAMSAYMFLHTLKTEAFDRSEKTDRDLRTYTNETYKLSNGTYCPLVDRIRISKTFEEKTGLSLTKEALELQNEKELQAEREQARDKAFREAVNRAGTTTDTKKAMTNLKADLSKIADPEEEDLYESTKNKTLEQEKAECEQSEPAIETDLYFYGEEEDEGYKREQLELPAGAITLICAPTGHGKTRLLVYLAMQALKHDKKNGTVLYFSVEENAQSIKRKFLNMYINKRLNHYKNNSKVIRDYMAMKDPSEKDLKELFNETNFDTFKERQRAFQDEYVDTDRLRIIYEKTRSVDRIAKAVLAIKKHQPITAVFIDYIQRLKKVGNFNANAKELLKEVTNDLMSLSIDTQVPFVIAVQFNRDVYSPIEMDLQNIGEASEIEFAANQAILCWNSKRTPQSKSAKWATIKKKGQETGETTEELTLKAKEFEKRTGITIGKAGKMYLQMAKGREGAGDLECILNVVGNTGAMTQNETEHEAVKEWKAQEERYKNSVQQQKDSEDSKRQQTMQGEGFNQTIAQNPDPKTPQAHTGKRYSSLAEAEAEMKKHNAEVRARKKAEKEEKERLKAEKKAQSETEEPQQGITIADIVAGIDKDIEQMDEASSNGDTSNSEDPNNAIGETTEGTPF